MELLVKAGIERRVYIYMYIYIYIYIWTRFFTGDFASWTVHFFNICVKNQQIHQLFIIGVFVGSLRDIFISRSALKG
jgi:hypothetical protein